MKDHKDVFTSCEIRIKPYPTDAKIAKWSKHSVRVYKSDPAAIALQLRGEDSYASVNLTRPRVLWLAKALTDLAEMIRDTPSHRHVWATSNDGLIDTCTICGEKRA